MLLVDCKTHFNTTDLYEILRVDRTATTSEIKKCYYKQSMKWHPDKADGDVGVNNATAKFQVLTRAYQVLSNKDRRTLYDESGIVDDENALEDEESINVWRRVFKKVTIEDIKKFAAEYQGSTEEENDIIAAYTLWKGDMRKIMESIMCASFEDEPRIKAVIDAKIKDGMLKKTTKYKSSTSQSNVMKRRRKAEKEAEEAAEALREIREKEGTGSLHELILQRHANRSHDDFLDSLAAKYGAKSKRTKK